MEDVRYPVGVQTFRNIIEEGYVYVDKTRFIPLLKRHAYCFLGRPRRFGKSLLLSTLREYFEGNRDLFRGLDIDGLEPGEWSRHPVFHIDLNNEIYNDKGAFVAIINKHIEHWEDIYGDQKRDRSISERFEWVVKRAVETTGQKAVILIDEYDKPLSDNILNDDLFRIYRDELRGFYASLKTLDSYIKFALLTGVTKFGKLNVFSGLNNLADISLNDDYADICGITEDELHRYFDAGVCRLAEKQNVDRDEMYRKLKQRYDGYHFSESSLDIYNPFSLLLALSNRKIRDYWFSTGNTKILVDLIIRNNIPLWNLEGAESTEELLSDLTYFVTNPIPLFYQTGYLTIKSYSPDFGLYTLGFPNEEVESGFLNDFMRGYGNTSQDSGINAQKMSMLLNEGEAKKFVEMLKAFLASMPYDLRKYQNYESFWQTVMYVLLTMLGYYTEAERHTSEGSIDLLVKTPGYIYVMELKVADRVKPTEVVDNGDGIIIVEDQDVVYGTPIEEDDSWDESAEVRRLLDLAVRQIEERCYADAFGTDGRKVIKIAAVFSAKRHNLAKALIF